MALFGGCWRSAVSVLALGILTVADAKASPALVVDVDSGKVLYDTMATTPWFPASLTKLMTTYVALSAVREGRISMDTPLMVSPRAASMAPSKMGFRPGTLVTLDNALKMLMVKSPNDIAVTVAEGISGSVEAFAEEMNTYGARLGLHESHFVNPNGLPDPNHFSSARDMAMIGRALLREFPEQHDLFGIGALAFGNQLISNHNGMLGRYPGVDGMKTGYTCSAGYNVVLSAQRDGKRLITVVLGAPSTATRTQRAAALFDRYFADSREDEGQLSSLPSAPPSAPPDLRGIVCGRGRANAIAEAESEDASIPLVQASAAQGGAVERSGAIERGNTSPVTTGPNVMAMTRASFTPVRVFVGPVDGWTGPIAHAKSMNPATSDVAAAPTVSASRDRTASISVLLQPTGRGPKEAPAPPPLALAGATAPVAAALATTALVGRTKTLSLAVPSSKRALHTTKHKLRPGIAASRTAGPAKTKEVKAPAKAVAHAPAARAKIHTAAKPKTAAQ